ncbi:MAG: hypothetical protein ABIR66_01030 [Saprospiraceae bacterium]
MKKDLMIHSIILKKYNLDKGISVSIAIERNTELKNNSFRAESSSTCLSVLFACFGYSLNDTLNSEQDKS